MRNRPFPEPELVDGVEERWGVIGFLFCRIVSGRGTGEGLLAHHVPF